MNARSATVDTADRRDLRDLNGRIVLVKSVRDQRNPPTGMRGWIELQEKPGRESAVNLALQFPEMFTSVARRRTIPLDETAVARLLASEHNGVFEFTLDGELD